MRTPATDFPVTQDVEDIGDVPEDPLPEASDLGYDDYILHTVAGRDLDNMVADGDVQDALIEGLERFLDGRQKVRLGKNDDEYIECEETLLIHDVTAHR